MHSRLFSKVTETQLKLCLTPTLSDIPAATASQVALVVKKPAANAGGARDNSLTSGSRRSPGVGKGNPCQYSCLENSTDRGTWRATIPGVWSYNPCDLKKLNRTELLSTTQNIVLHNMHL